MQQNEYSAKELLEIDAIRKSGLAPMAILKCCALSGQIGADLESLKLLFAAIKYDNARGYGRHCLPQFRRAEPPPGEVGRVLWLARRASIFFEISVKPLWYRLHHRRNRNVRISQKEKTTGTRSGDFR